MKHYGLEIPEGSDITNITVPSGTSFPVGPNNPPNMGELFYRSDSSILHLYTGTGWAAMPLGTVSATPTKQEFTATSGQTTFTVTNGYEVGNIIVFLNGVRLDEADYTATNGSDVVLDVGATAGDTLAVEGYADFAITNYYTKSEGDSRYALVASPNTFSAYQTIQDAYPALRIRDTSTNITDGGLWGFNVAAGSVSLRVNTAVGGDFSTANVPLVVDYTAQQLVVGTSDITFGGQSLARVGTTNIFTADQKIQKTSPLLLFNDSGSTDQNFGWRIVVGSAYLTQFSDAGAGLYNAIRVDSASSQLHLSTSDITFAGSSLARAGVQNSFTAKQNFTNATAALDVTNANSEITFSGNVLLRGFGASNTGFITAGVAGDNTKSITIRGRTTGGSVVNHLVLGSDAKTLATTTSIYSYDGESQMLYTGRVASTGTAVRLPSGWSSAQVAAGHYRINHTIGHTNYAPLVTPYNNAVTGCRVPTITSTYFDVIIYNSAGTATDSYFHFMCTPWS